MQHHAFIETKWLVKGWEGHRFEQDAIRRVASVHDDIAKLRRHLDLGRCQVAAVLVIDDENYFATSTPVDGAEPVEGVWQLLVGPKALEARGLVLSDWSAGSNSRGGRARDSEAFPAAGENA